MTDSEMIRIDTRVVYKNRWMRVRENRVKIDEMIKNGSICDPATINALHLFDHNNA